VETYDITDEVAGELLDVIVSIVDAYEAPIINHYGDEGSD
jgi:hypothetical protein